LGQIKGITRSASGHILLGSHRRKEQLRRMNIRKVAIGFVFGAVCLFSTREAALAVPLPPTPPAAGADATVALPGTTSAAEPVLAGTVVFDKVSPWAFGAFNGTVQTRVVKSSVNGRLAFYYRITNQSRPPLRVRTFFVDSPSFRSIVRADVNYRKDGLGTVGPNRAIRKKAGTPVAGVIGFSFDRPVILAGQSSRFFFIRTSATRFSTRGAKLDMVVQNTPGGTGSGPSASQRLDAPRPIFP
jgi:hypothetical protein